MQYKVELTNEAWKQLTKAPQNIQKRILSAIRERLTENPRRFKALLSNWEGHYRLRVGDYRVIYRIEEDIVTVMIVKIAPRGKVYE